MRRFVRWHVVLLTLLIITIIFRQSILIGMARWLDVGEDPRSVDYVMVLPGGPERRPFVAAAMIKRGLANHVLTAETETDPSTDEGVYPSTDQNFQRIMSRRGVQEDQIQILPGHSKSTWTDATALATFLRDHPKATVAIVTDEPHTRRSSWTFRRVLGEAYHQVHFVSARMETVGPENWWQSQEGISIYCGEYCKLAAYILTDPLYCPVISIVVLCASVVWFWRNQRRPTLSERPASPST